MKIKIILTYAFIATIFFGCTKEGTTGQSSLLNLIPEPPGANCASGGIKVVSGIDANRNNVLEDNEIQNVKYVCNGADGSSGSADKQVILYFPATGSLYSDSSASGYIDSIEVINNFNITNYPNVDSISFSAYLQTSDPSVTCTVDLYDRTNNVAINNTTLVSNSTSGELKTTTVNFVNDLPPAAINLGIRVKSGQAGTVVNYYLPVLIIYRQ